MERSICAFGGPHHGNGTQHVFLEDLKVSSFQFIGLSSQRTSSQPDSSIVSVSVPVSRDGTESLGNEKVLQVQSEQISRSPKKSNTGKVGRPRGSGGRTPSSVAPLRRSSHLNTPQQEVSSGSAGRSTRFASSVSVPASPVSRDGTESLGNEKILQVQSEEISRSPEKRKHGKAGRPRGSGGRTPSSIALLRRSSRLNTPQQEVSSGSADRSPRSASYVYRNSRSKWVESRGSADRPRLQSLRSRPDEPKEEIRPRRKRKMWSAKEEEALNKGVQEFGADQWKQILEKYKGDLSERTMVELKDKWRNMRKKH